MSPVPSIDEMESNDLIKSLNNDETCDSQENRELCKKHAIALIWIIRRVTVLLDRVNVAIAVGNVKPPPPPEEPQNWYSAAIAIAKISPVCLLACAIAFAAWVQAKALGLL